MFITSDWLVVKEAAADTAWKNFWRALPQYPLTLLCVLALEVGGSSRRCRSEPRVQRLAGGEFVLVGDKMWHTARSPPQVPGQVRDCLVCRTLSSSGHCCKSETSLLADPRPRSTKRVLSLWLWEGKDLGRHWAA